MTLNSEENKPAPRDMLLSGISQLFSRSVSQLATSNFVTFSHYQYNVALAVLC